MLKITGLEKLDQLQKAARELSNTKSAPLSEVLSPAFLAKNTKFTSLEQLFESGGFKVDSKEDLEAIPDEQMDAHVRANSDFPDWNSLLQAAGKEWAVKKMGLR
jgi:hypothetical protein